MTAVDVALSALYIIPCVIFFFFVKNDMLEKPDKTEENVDEQLKKNNKKNNKTMTREEAKEFYPILQAYAEGKVIECRTKPNTMKGADTPNDWTEMKEIEFWRNIEYRIKQESKYRPFESAQECIEEMRKHEPFGWVKNRPNAGDFCSSITDICCDGVAEFIRLRGNWYSSYDLLEYYTFLDGSPFGVKVEDKEE